MIQSVGPNCVISLNMPPLPFESTQSQSPTPSSLTSSPTCTKEMSNSILSSALSSATSDLANSFSSLYSISGDQSNLTDGKSGDFVETTAIATHSMYHNGLGLIKSYPLSGGITANMQTFPKDPQNRNNSSKLYGNVNRLLYDHSNLFKKRSHLENSTCSFNREYYRSRDQSKNSGLEEIDPYDTDEFDYCTTEEEDEEIDQRINNSDCHKSSNDKGK